MRPLGVAIGLCLAVAACGGGSGSGSLGSAWFSGGGREAQAETEVAVLDPTVPVTALRGAVLEPALRGAILRVEGVAPSLGYHSATLRLRGPDADGRVLAEMRAVPPATPVSGRSAGQALTAAVFVPRDVLDQVDQFDINAASGAITLRP
ncbi:MAG: hypothetical protein AAFR93_10840 [Pseudomonadota bacterium]